MALELLVILSHAFANIIEASFRPAVQASVFHDPFSQVFASHLLHTEIQEKQSFDIILDYVAGFPRNTATMLNCCVVQVQPRGKLWPSRDTPEAATEGATA